MEQGEAVPAAVPEAAKRAKHNVVGVGRSSGRGDWKQVRCAALCCCCAVGPRCLLKTTAPDSSMLPFCVCHVESKAKACICPSRYRPAPSLPSLHQRLPLSPPRSRASARAACATPSCPPAGRRR